MSARSEASVLPSLTVGSRLLDLSRNDASESECLRLSANGTLRQNGSTGNMIFSADHPCLRPGGVVELEIGGPGSRRQVFAAARR